PALPQRDRREPQPVDRDLTREARKSFLRIPGLGDLEHLDDLGEPAPLAGLEPRMALRALRDLSEPCELERALCPIDACRNDQQIPRLVAVSVQHSIHAPVRIGALAMGQRYARDRARRRIQRLERGRGDRRVDMDTAEHRVRAYLQPLAYEAI